MCPIILEILGQYREYRLYEMGLFLSSSRVNLNGLLQFNPEQRYDMKWR